MYLPSINVGRPSLVVRTSGDPLALTSAVRAAVQSVDKDQPVSNVASMEQILSSSVGEPRFRTLLLTVFAALALALAGVGIYGVMSYTVARRTHEIGIRMALGARPGDTIKLVVGQGLTLAITGVAVGLVGAFALTRLLSSLLFEVSPTDPLTFVGDRAAAYKCRCSGAATYRPEGQQGWIRCSRLDVNEAGSGFRVRVQGFWFLVSCSSLVESVFSRDHSCDWTPEPETRNPEP